MIDFARAADVVQRGVAGGAFPAAVVEVGSSDARVWHQAFGTLDYDAESPATQTNTIFDLASLTKVIATTPMILQLADEGRLDLDRPLTDAIPDLRQYDPLNAAERRITFRDCLAHRTFLPAVEPIYTYGDDPERLSLALLTAARMSVECQSD